MISKYLENGLICCLVFLTFPYPVPLAQSSRDVPKNYAILLAATSNHEQATWVNAKYK